MFVLEFDFFLSEKGDVCLTLNPTPIIIRLIFVQFMYVPKYTHMVKEARISETLFHLETFFGCLTTDACAGFCLLICLTDSN
jgi:hypothetical protein